MGRSNKHCYILPNSANPDNKCSDKMFYGKPPTGFRFLCPFGQVSYVANRKKIKSKFEMRGSKNIFIGYAENSARYTYRMYNPKTRSIVETHDVQWAEWHGGPSGK